MSPVRFSGVALFVLTALLALAALTAAFCGETISAHTRAEALRGARMLTVRVLAPTADDAAARAATLLKDTPGVSSARPLSRARAAQLIANAGGGTVDPALLPATQIVEVVRDPVHADDTTLARRLEEAGLRAELYADPPDAEGLRAAALARGAGLGGALLLFCLLALVWRQTALSRPDAAAIGADLGAPRTGILARYGRAGAEFAFMAGLLGGLATTAGAAGVLSAPPHPLALRDMIGRIGAMDIALFLTCPLATALAAALGARAGAGAAYDRADRLG
jgi:cell division protein FtsX